VNFQGQGTDVKNIKIDADGKLAYMDLMGKRYNNVTLDGRLENQRFNGFLGIQDPQLTANYNGIFDFSKKPYQLKFTSKVGHINFDYLGVTKNMNAKVRGEIEGDFAFSTVDDFLGEINLKNLYFTSKADTLEIAEAYI